MFPYHFVTDWTTIGFQTSSNVTKSCSYIHVSKIPGECSKTCPVQQMNKKTVCIMLQSEGQTSKHVCTFLNDGGHKTLCSGKERRAHEDTLKAISSIFYICVKSLFIFNIFFSFNLFKQASVLDTRDSPTHSDVLL